MAYRAFPPSSQEGLFVLADIALQVGKPRVVMESTTGFVWFPDVIGLSTGELFVTHTNNPDSLSNASNTFDLLRAATQSSQFQLAATPGGFHVGCGQPTIALANGTAIGGRQYFLTPTPNNGTPVSTFTCDRLTYSTGGVVTSEPNAMSITFPVAVLPNAGSATCFARAFWFGRIVDLGGNVWITNMQWTPNASGGVKLTNGCFRSTDLGYTWAYIGEIGAPADVPGSTEGFSEPAICRLSNGNLFSVSRTDSLAAMYEATSTDNGVTWSTPTASTHPGSAAPSLITLSNGVTVELAGIGGGMTFRFTRNNTTTWRSWDGLAYHNALAVDDTGLPTIAAVTTTDYFGIQEISPNRIAVVYDYLPGARAGQPGNGTQLNKLYILEFDVALL